MLALINTTVFILLSDDLVHVRFEWFFLGGKANTFGSQDPEGSKRIYGIQKDPKESRKIHLNKLQSISTESEY